ncbi:MAG TPA: zinc ribbon domain-containing protein [Chloroflexota bacterium]|jgi:putative FmdB family regulatory protein|nr:zinc ribbon domain-containing protein [Chloroflexota bacterium]
MPIYEYRCESCRRYHQQLVLSLASYQTPACPRCGEDTLRKLVSRFAVMKSEESRLEDLADPSSFGDLDENDPRSVARWARKMGDRLGEDLGPEFDEMVGRMEAGELSDEEGGLGGDDTGDDVGSAAGSGPGDAD